MEKSEIFLWITLFSLLLLIASGAAAFGRMNKFGKDVTIFWTIINEELLNILFYLNSVNYIILYILFAILLLYALASCIIIFINRKDSNFVNGMFGPLSKFNFIPLLCASALFIIGECFYNINNFNDAPFICSLIFSAIGVGCLITIYIKTDISSSPIYVRLATKKGLYPCLIALFVYNFCFTFSFYGSTKKSENIIRESLLNWTKGCSIAFSIIIGIANLCLAFFLNDICVAGMNAIIYIGLIISFFHITKKIRSAMNGLTEGIIEIVIEVLSLTIIVFLIYKNKNKNLN